LAKAPLVEEFGSASLMSQRLPILPVHDVVTQVDALVADEQRQPGD
jgi:hypothetical protein